MLRSQVLQPSANRHPKVRLLWFFKRKWISNPGLIPVCNSQSGSSANAHPKHKVLLHQSVLVRLVVPESESIGTTEKYGRLSNQSSDFRSLQSLAILEGYRYKYVCTFKCTQLLGWNMQ